VTHIPLVFAARDARIIALVRADFLPNAASLRQRPPAIDRTVYVATV